MGRFADLADLDWASAVTVLTFLAEEAGTTVVEAAIVSIRTMELADASAPDEARSVVGEVSRELVGGKLRFPVSNRPLRTSCHPAHAVLLILLILENLRPSHHPELCAGSHPDTVRPGRPHLTLVPPAS